MGKTYKDKKKYRDNEFNDCFSIQKQRKRKYIKTKNYNIKETDKEEWNDMQRELF